MGAEYTRQSTFTDGDIITAAHSNDEFNQLLAAFAASTGHTHDGTTAEGGPITKLLGDTLTFGTGSDTDIAITFDGNTSDGVLTWKEDEDYFEFSDDILIASSEKLQFRDTAIHISSSTDGQLDLVADGAVLVDTAGDITLDADGGDVVLKDGGTQFASLTNTSGNLIIKSGSTTAMTFDGANVTFAGTVTIGSAGISEAELEILDGATVTTDELNILDGVTATTAELNIMDGVTATTAELNIMDGDTSATSTTVADADRVVLNDNGTMKQVAVTDLSAYFDDEITAMPNLVTVSTLDSGAISSGFGNIDIGSSNLTATGTISLGATSFNDNNITNVGSVQLDSIAGDADTNTSIAFSGSDVITMTTGGTTALTIDASQNVTVAGDLTVSGDDITLGTNTSGHIMVADGTNFNPVAVSGDVTISNTGAVTIANDAVETAMLNANVISGQSAETSLDTSNDTLLMFDNSASGLKKITLATLSSGLGGITDVVADTSPQLGGDLDVNGNAIVSASNGNIALTPNGSGVVRIDGSNGIDMQSGSISIKNSGSQSYVDFYCESSNAHYARLQAPAHSAFSGNITLTLPATTDTITGIAATQTLTNKTLTSPKINEDVAVTATATEINILDGVTSTTAELNILDGVTSTTAELNILDGVTSTAAELNILDGVTSTTAELNILDGVTSTAAELNILDGVTSTATELNVMDGDTSASSITLADADRLVTNDGGTMKQVALTTLKTYLTSAGFSSEDPTALAIALG
tara:strand:- start:699 stop:2972 length:2274 start_codon:yes stop_codon:yes gene_type:complete